MKKIFLFFIATAIVYSTQAQKLDLEKVTFKEDYKTLTAGHQRIADHDIVTTLPEYGVTDVTGYSFGPVKVQGGDSSVEFLLNNEKDRKPVGMVIRFETNESAKAAYNYILKHYPKLTRILQKAPKQQPGRVIPSPAGYLWTDIRPGVSMIVSTFHSIEDDKPLDDLTLIILQDDVKIKYPTANKTALNKALATYTIKEQ